MHTQCSALLEHYKNTLHKLSEIRLKLMCMCITVECAVCVCPKMNVPLGPSSRQASKLPGNGARENSPQQEPGTTNQCQWMSLDDVMTWASSPLMGGWVHMSHVFQNISQVEVGIPSLTLKPPSVLMERTEGKGMTRCKKWCSSDTVVRPSWA